jgi:hypothetical protein
VWSLFSRAGAARRDAFAQLVSTLRMVGTSI